MDISWYLRRLQRMTPREAARRLRDEAVKRWMWVRRSRIGPSEGGPAAPGGPVPLPDGGPRPDADAAAGVIAAAEEILRGRWSALGVERTDMAPAPDWFLDPATGIRAPEAGFTFGINPRDPGAVGNVKNVWESARHHHVTVLAAAYRISGREEFAAAAAANLVSWWDRNPFLEGIHWRSGIELGIRLISWTWARRLLDGWPGTVGLFEGNPVFRAQLYRHLYYLARLPSHGSSANNHLIAEEAGRFTACCAFPWFAESEGWRAESAAALAREAAVQTFPDGLNRELATGYHGFVLELLLVAALEGEAAGIRLGPEVWERIGSMLDALAAIVDAGGGAPRQGDDDEGSALVIGDAGADRWTSLLAAGEWLVGRLPWWPPSGRTDVRTAFWSALAGSRIGVGNRPDERPGVFREAGMVILRDPDPNPDEIWCRCDGGPHGFLSIAGHAHADALSIEVRIGGVEVLADPGTYCYHTDPRWRTYFRSTRGHNTLELAGEDQSVAGGPFNWTRHAAGTTVSVSGAGRGLRGEWVGEHDGYSRLDPPAIHRRRVILDRKARRLTVEDRIVCDGIHPCRLSFHLGPDIECRLDGTAAALEWKVGGSVRRAWLHLPGSLRWERVRGREDPPAGWYSPGLGVKVPAVTLVGAGEVGADSLLVTTMGLVEGSGEGPGTPMDSEADAPPIED